MSTASDLHDQAMVHVDEAFVARHRGDIERAQEHSQKALRLEIAAAEEFRDSFTTEPTRSVLYRSAATIALDCGQHREAERLIATALAGSPPYEIAEELRDLLEQVNFERHLKLRGVMLEERELQIVVTGRVIGFGLALSDVVLSRVEDLKRMLQRTIERKLGQPFRDQGPPKTNSNYGFYISAPRSGSFALTLRLGLQMELPGFEVSSQAIGEVVQCMELINAAKEEEVKTIIGDDSYYRNFVNLAKRIAPDGDKVNQVGLTIVAQGQEKRVSFSRTREDIQSTFNAESTGTTKSDSVAKVRGRLLLADATKPSQKIQLIERSNEGGKKRHTIHSIIVPRGMMSDIVRPLWDDFVEVTGVRVGKSIRLTEIVPVEE